MSNAYEESLKVTFKKIAANELGTEVALYVTSLTGIGLMISGVNMTSLKLAALCLAGVGVKAAVSYCHETLKSVSRQLSHLS